MSDRITEKMLQSKIDHLNKITNAPLQTYAKDLSSGRYIAQKGNYHLDGAYGGWKLCQISNENGAARDVSLTGFTTRRRLYEEISMYIYGLLDAKEII